MSDNAIVVGSGPNGLAAAVTLARAGITVTVLEAADRIGGASGTAQLTLPGFAHDVGSAVHPLAVASPFFRAFELANRIDFVTPEISYAHPMAPGRSALAWRDIAATAEGLGADGRAWRRLIEPLARSAAQLAEVTGSSLVRIPHHPFLLAQLGIAALEQGTSLWNKRFSGEDAPALLTGAMAHAIHPLPGVAPAAAGLVLAAHAHAGGWPIPVGGSQSIANALATDLLAHGGSIETGVRVSTLAELPPAGAVVLDVNASALPQLLGSALSPAFDRTLRRFRPGNGVAKVDFALSGPVPWLDEQLLHAGTVHLGGNRANLVASAASVAGGGTSDFILISQPSLFDSTRAPAGKHVLWAYTHVPAGSTWDAAAHVTRAIERFAPGFTDTILGARASDTVRLEAANSNLLGGDIAAGAVSFGQLVRRPTLIDPWRLPVRGVYLCSASTAPGPGVHGMGGWNAALSALRHEFGVRTAPPLSPGR